MKIGVLGAGNVGGTLGSGWARKGHQVTFGVTDPGADKVKSLLASAGTNAHAASLSEAAATSEVVALAVPWEAAQEVVQKAGKLSGKILIDATNPLIMSPQGLSQGLVLGHSTSAGEQVARWATGARVVKAFNTTGAGNMANSDYAGQKLTMFLCGDDGQSKGVVAKLSQELGFEPLDCGPLRSARLLEPVAMLWIHLALGQGMGTNFGFTVLKR
jgi:8-hydroxy-5-deazaflavin:NADPH oxidoreductase